MAIGRKPHHFLLGCLSVLMTWQLNSPKASDDPREGKVEDAVSFMAQAQKSYIISSNTVY